MSELTSLYGLVDPRTNTVFYVGITKYNLRARFTGHRSDRASAAWGRIREIEEDNQQCHIHLLADFYSRDEAREVERELIRRHPGLCNRDCR